MYDNHLRISGQNGAFRWLLDGHLAADSTIHPTNCPESRVLRVSNSGALILCVSSHKRVLLNDYKLYNGSYKEWLSPIMEFNMFNPVKTFRMVCVLGAYCLINYILVGLFILGGDGSCISPRCDCNFETAMCSIVTNGA